MTKVINFYGGPSAGKSTNGAKLFAHMKEQRMNVEFVPEFAKELTWKKDLATLDDQLFVLATQHHRLYTLLGQVDYIVTDSPLLLSLHYWELGFSKFNKSAPYFKDNFFDLTLQLYAKYDNLNFYVERGDRAFVQAGRNQSEEESKDIDDKVFRLLSTHMIPFKRISTLEEVLETINGTNNG